MKSSSTLAVFVLMAALSHAALAAVDASLDRDQVQPGESVQLSLQYDGSGGGEPDLAPLKKDFDVLGTSSGTSIQIVNGHVSRQHEVRITLSPKRSGILPIPSLSWSGEQSAALKLTVGAGAAGSSADSAGAAAGASPHVFVTATLNDAHPYVQSSAILTVQVHTDLPLYQASLDLSGSGDLLVQPIGQDRQTRETRDGHAFDVVERRYLLQPQRSGALSLPGPTLDAQIPDTRSRNPLEADPFFGNALQGRPFAGTMNRTRPMRLHGDAIELTVRPRAVGASGPDWLPASQVTLESILKPDDASVHAGEPLTLHLGLTAQGLTGAQLPDLSGRLALPDGVKAYPDQAKLDTQLQAGGIVGSREQDIALIASKPGHYRIPATRLQWWDTRADIQREIVIPERTIDVLPAVGGTAAPTAPATDDAKAAILAPPPAQAAVPTQPETSLGKAATGPQSPWPWISLALGLLWLATLIAWWLRRRIGHPEKPSKTQNIQQAGEEPDAAAARTAFHQACRSDDPVTARRQLLAWARGTYRSNPPAGLNALAKRLDKPELTELLRQLDRACYSGGEWRGEALAKALTVLDSAAKAGTRTPPLAPLYP